jgi:hypothetical protein
MELLCIRGEFCQLLAEESGDSIDRIYLFGSNACYVLFARGLYHLCSDDRLREDIASALSNLHGEQSCQASDLMSSLLHEQPRYNGHLETFLNQCKRILLREARKVCPLTEAAISQITDHRR